jgi:MoxR-like ATPase
MAAEDEMLERLRAGNPVSNLKPVLNAQMLTQMQQHVANIFVDPQVKDYMLRLVRATRETSKLALGASPRASIALYRTAQALAAVEGRSYIIPDDIKRLAVPVLAHRLILQPEFRLRRESGASVVEEILNSTEVPSGITQTFRPKTMGSGAGEIDGKVN